MKTAFECFPCILRHAFDVVSKVTSEKGEIELVLRKMASRLSEVDMAKPPPLLGREVHRTVREVTGVRDPFAKEKARTMETALDMLGDLRRRVDQSSDPFDTALRLTLAGNVIDFGASSDVSGDDMLRAVEDALGAPIDCAGIEKLKAETNSAESILYIGDNAGEIVFDRLLVEKLPPGTVTFAVRGGPIINDALLTDAEAAGLPEVCRVISSGCDAPGIILEECSDEFKEVFKADVIIAKGQGNFETLNEQPRSIFFLLKAKCPVVARELDCVLGDYVVYKTP